jgi:hypothetical protein
MARPTTPPGAEHAAEQALDHIPTELPPEFFSGGSGPPEPPTLPTAAAEHMPEQAQTHQPDWFII